MRAPSFSVILLSLWLLVAHSSVLALSIPRSLKAPPRLKSIRTLEQWTNGERLAAGLPRARRARSSVRQPRTSWPPPRSSAPPRARARVHSRSPDRTAVETAHSGKIVARSASTDTPVVGFVRTSSSGVGLGKDTEGEHVTFSTPGPKALFSIGRSDLGEEAAANEESSTPAFLGAKGTSALGTGSASAVRLNVVPQTSKHARPTAAGAESAIWSFDASSHALTPHWVNPDGSHPPTRVVYSAREGTLVLTGDVNAYKQAHPDDNVAEVTLYLETA
ncbi:hypothetical protein BD413DRAFT_603534 [Trametes elegans]|nr:hypothetical protein BD413DRAFT_603534 [Trametes elegans]